MSFGNAFGAFANGAAGGYAMGKSIKKPEDSAGTKTIETVDAPTGEKEPPAVGQETQGAWGTLSGILGKLGVGGVASGMSDGTGAMKMADQTAVAKLGGSSVVGGMLSGNGNAGKSIIGGLGKLF